MSVEASVTFATGDAEIGDDLEDSDDQGDDENGETEGEEAGEISGDALYFTGGIVYNFRPKGRFKPYVTGGAGLVRINLDGNNESRPAGIFGGGFMLNVSQSLLVRVDARDHLYTVDQGGGSTTRNDLSLTGGVSVKF